MGNTLATIATLRRFQLVRREDASGVSGCGIVAEGVAFGDGRAVMAWKRSALDPLRPGAINTYASVDELEATHGHGGRTQLVWLDEMEWKTRRRSQRSIPRSGRKRFSRFSRAIPGTHHARLARN